MDTAVRQAMEARAARQAMVADTGEARGMAEAPVGTVVVRTARRVTVADVADIAAAAIHRVEAAATPVVVEVTRVVEAAAIPAGATLAEAATTRTVSKSL